VIVPTDAVAGDAVDRLDLAPERIAVGAEAPARAFTPRPDAEGEAVRAAHPCWSRSAPCSHFRGSSPWSPAGRWLT